MEATDKRAPKQTVAIVVAVAALLLLIINVADVGLDNFKEFARLALFVLVFLLALWWLKTRESARWIGWLVGLVFAALIVFNLASFGLNNFIEVITIVLLAVLFVITAGWAIGRGRGLQ